MAGRERGQSSKDSGRYKVANCTQAQPVFYGFAGLPDGKVILVSVLTLGGRQVAVPRLRVRRADGEAPLPSFQWAAATDPLDEHTLSAVAAGVSTRRYAGTLDPAPAEVTERGTSSSAVSRRFVALSAKRLRSFLSRPLRELDLRVVCIDGKVFRDHCMVVALGIDTQGRKHVLGLREGATETAVVTSGLLSDLVTRGLPTDRTLLFVIDGAPGLRRAITDVFGSLGVVQRRCGMPGTSSQRTARRGC